MTWTIADPPPVRWTAKCKAAIVCAILEHRLSSEIARRRFNLSSAELYSWVRLYRAGGSAALRSTQLQTWRR